MSRTKHERKPNWMKYRPPTPPKRGMKIKLRCPQCGSGLSPVYSTEGGALIRSCRCSARWSICVVTDSLVTLTRASGKQAQAHV